MAYLKNNASPLPVKAKVTNATTGAPITSGVAAYHITGVTRAAGGGTLAHIASGDWNYIPTQAETNYDEFAIEFYHADAVCEGSIVQVLTDAKLVSALNDLSAANVNTECDTAISDAGIPAAVWAVLTSTLTTASSIGKLIVDNLNAAITSRAATGAKMDLIDAPNATAVAAFTAGFWAALTSGMATAGSIGKKLADWVVGTIDTYTGNTKQTGDAFARLGAPAGASVSADVAAVKSDTAATLADTNELQTNQGDWLTATGFSTFDPDTDTVARVTLVDTCSVNTDMVDAPDNASITAIKAKTDIIPADLVATLDAILEDTGTTLEAKLVAIKAAVYDSATVSGSVITLSDGAEQTLSAGGRTTA